METFIGHILSIRKLIFKRHDNTSYHSVTGVRLVSKTNTHIGDIENEAKVAEFAATVLCHEDIVRFDVHVNQVVFMEMLHGLKNITFEHV